MSKKRITRIAALSLSIIFGLSGPIETAAAHPSADSSAGYATEIESETPAPEASPESDTSPLPDGSETPEEETAEPSKPASSAVPEAVTSPEAEPSESQPPESSVEPEPQATPSEPSGVEIFDAVSADFPEGCTYAADDSGGAYAQTLCWIDFSQITTAGGSKHALTTEYKRHGGLGNYKWLSLLDPPECEPTREGCHSTNNYGPGVGTRYGDVKNLGVNVQLSDHLVMSAKLDISGSNSPSRSRNVIAQQFPTFGADGGGSGAFLGRNGFYVLPEGGGAKPAIYQQDGLGRAARTEITLHDIEVKRVGNNGELETVHDYSIVVADAESTDNGESISWITTGTPFEWLPNDPTRSGRAGTFGNACNGGWAPAFGSTATEASCVADRQQAGNKTGTPMLHTAPDDDSDFEITTNLKGDGQQGVAFGILFSRAQVNVEVDDRILDADGQPRTAEAFEAYFGVANTSGVTQTGTSDTASTGTIEAPVEGAGSPVEFTSRATGEYADSYTPAWTCTKNDITTGDGLQWPSSGTSDTPPPNDSSADFGWLKPGELIDCTVTYTPPYLSLDKDIDTAGTAATNSPDDFTLRASGTSDPKSTFEGNAGTEQVQRRPVAVGDYNLTEAAPDPEAKENWEHGYAWSDLVCELDGGRLIDDVVEIEEDDATGAIDEATLAVAAGQDISCTYTNVALEPQLEVSTTSDPDSGEPVEPDQLVTYRLVFDNQQGTAPISADHVDHLRDVLDDAELVESSLVDDGLDVAQEITGDNPRLLITGTVPAGAVKTIEFQVRVKPHDENLDERKQSQDGQQGYTLNNFVTERLDPNGDPLDTPDTCDDDQSSCTTHPVPAWTVDTGSRPADGARLNRGGNTHYVLTATKLNAATQIDELVFSDDLTHVFKTAGWAPDAEVPGGARSRGIFFVDADGNTLDTTGEVNGTADDPSPAYDADSVGEPEKIGERWILESDPVDVPDDAVTAELWFAVEAGQNPADIPADAAWQGPNAPQNGWQYVNYVAAEGAQSQPVQCGTATWVDGTPDVSRSAIEDPVDDSIAEACRTQHELNSGHFTIRKDAVGTGIDLPNGQAERDIYGDSSTGLWNLVNHEFEIHDDIDGSPSEHPSQYLCRSDYHPESWDGEFTAHDSDRSLDDWGADTGGDSETLEAIRDHNAQVSDPDEALPECALFYPQPEGSGGQTGRYRGENFQPVLAEDTVGEPRDFWLNETAAPTHQISLDGQQTREVPGIQILSEPIAFRVWPDQDGQHHEGPIFYGKRQLDVRAGDEFLERCEPGASAHDRDVACVNPTGYLMLVQDTVPMRLPLTGGNWLGTLTAIGLGLVLVALSGTWWYRQRKNSSTRS